MDIKTKLETLKNNLKKAEQLKTVTETQIDSYTQQMADIVLQMKSLHTTPETIEADIKQLEESMQDGIERLEAMIPQV